jgi:hypothetical protein
MNINIELKSVNLEALDADLRAALGAKISGVSYQRGVLTLHLLDSASEVEQASARAIVATHDPARLSTGQQAQVRLKQSRLENRDNPLSLDAFNSQLPLIRALAAKIAWLEQEILDLRR